MDRFQNLDPPYFDGDPISDALELSDKCYKILRNLGLVESNSVDFTTF